MLDRRVFAEGFTGMCELFDKKASEALFRVYYEALKGMSNEDFKRAVGQVVMTRKYTKMPMPAEILAVVRGNPEDQALTALEKVKGAMREHGAYKSVVFDDPIIHDIIERATCERTGEAGWIGLCAMPLDEFKWWAKDFLKLYVAKLNGPRPQGHRPLIGVHEHTNKLNGYPWTEPPALVGDEKRAKALIEATPKVPELEMKEVS